MRIRCKSVSLVPRRRIPLAGWAHEARKHPWEKVDAPLSIELLQLIDARGNDIIFGSIDTLFVGAAFSQDLRQKLGTAARNLCLFATHTHNAPSLFPEAPLLGVCDEAWYGEVLEATASAVEQVLQGDAREVSIALGACETELNVNRRLSAYAMDYRGLLEGRFSLGRKVAAAPNPDGLIDKFVRCLFFEDEAGSVPAVIWCYPAHAAFYPFPLAVSSDYPGKVREHLRRRFGPGCAVIFLPGLAGSAIPRIPFSFPRTFRDAFKRCLPLYPNLPSFHPAGFSEWARALASRVDLAFQSRARVTTGEEAVEIRRAVVESIFSGDRAGRPCEIDLNLHLIRLGQPLSVLAGNGELLGEWDPLLETFPQQNLIKSGYLAGDALYIPTSQQLPEGGYEVEGFKKYFGLRGSFDPGITQKVRSALRGLSPRHELA